MLVCRDWYDESANWLTGFGYRFALWPVPFGIYSDVASLDQHEMPLFLYMSNDSVYGSGEKRYTSVPGWLITNASMTQTDQFKIAITAEDGITQLPVEIMKWDVTNFEFSFAFRAPAGWNYTIADAEEYDSVYTYYQRRNKPFFFYYDPAADENTEYVGHAGSAPARAVWSDFAAVWHMNETPVNGRRNHRNSIAPALSDSDDFTGTNGDAPDTGKWTVTGSVDIQGNKLRTVTDVAQSSVDYAERIAGDFDIQIDCEKVTTPLTDSWNSVLRIWSEDKTTRVGQIGYRYTSGEYAYIQIMVHMYNGSTWTIYNPVDATSIDSTKFRIERVYNRTTFSYWNGSAWVELVSDTTNFGVDALLLQVRSTYWGGTPEVTFDWDNFSVTGTDGKTYGRYYGSDTSKGYNLAYGNIDSTIRQVIDFESGDSNYIEVDPDLDSPFTFGGTDGFAIMALVDWETVAAWDKVFSSTGIIGFGIEASKYPKLELVNNDDGSFVSLTDGTVVSANTHMMTGTWDGTTGASGIKLFYNETELATGQATIAGYAGCVGDGMTPTASIRIGAVGGGGSNFDGRMGGVYVINKGVDKNFITAFRRSWYNGMFIFGQPEGKSSELIPEYRMPIHVWPTNIDADLYDYAIKLNICEGAYSGKDDQALSDWTDQMSTYEQAYTVRFVRPENQVYGLCPGFLQYGHDTNQQYIYWVNLRSTLDSDNGDHIYIYFDADMSIGTMLRQQHQHISPAVFNDYSRLIMITTVLDPAGANSFNDNNNSVGWIGEDGTVGNENVTVGDIGCQTSMGIPYVDLTNNECLTWPDNSSYDRTNDTALTVEAFLQCPTDLPDRFIIFSKRINSGDYEGFELYIDDSDSGEVRFLYDQGVGTTGVATGGSNLDDGTGYHHVAAAYSGSDTQAGLVLYVDGVAQAAAGTNGFPAGSWANSEKPCIGARADAFWPSSTRGLVGEVRYSQHRVPAAMIKANYYANTDELTTFGDVEAYTTRNMAANAPKIQYTPVAVEYVGVPIVQVEPGTPKIEYTAKAATFHRTAEFGRISKAVGDGPRITDGSGGQPSIADARGE